MKNYCSVGERTEQLQRHSPSRAPLLPSPAAFRTRASLSRSRDKEQDSTDLLLTERTKAREDQSRQPKEPEGRANIKSYLRIRPSATASPLLKLALPHAIHCDRTTYRFDGIFEAGASQVEVYDVAGKEAVNAFLEGHNATIFAYGSTGSGKTYTMFGEEDGLVPSAVKEIFGRVEEGARLSCSMVEIYRQSLTDLLLGGGPQLKIKEAGTSCVVHNLSSHPVTSQEEALALITRGNFLKRIRETDLNESSSRSHVVFTVQLEKSDAQGRSIVCRLNLVDLAGSEKVSRSKVEGEGLQEAKKINLSLSCLANTISALARRSEHVPYRESKLTRILKDSLMGTSLTRLIVTCSLSDEALHDTISSFKFAQRAQKISTQPEIAYLPQKEQRERCLQAAVDRLEADASRIARLLLRQPCECSNCAEIQQILSKKAPLPVLSFKTHPPAFRSPTHAHAQKPYFSTASLEKTKYPTLAKPNYLSWKDASAERDALSRRLQDLKAENQNLREDKQKLQAKIKAQEEKERATNAKKIIKLGERLSKGNKENQMTLANVAQGCRAEKGGTNSKKITTQNQPIQGEAENALKVHECSQSMELMQEATSKLEAACCEYRSTLYPLHLHVLHQQVALLRERLSSSASHSHTPSRCCSDSLRISALLITLQKKLCSYVESVGDIVPRLLQGSRCEGRNELSEVLKQKLQEVSDIKWSFKEFYEQSVDLQSITELLGPLTRLPSHSPALLSPSHNEFLSVSGCTLRRGAE